MTKISHLKYKIGILLSLKKLTLFYKKSNLIFSIKLIAIIILFNGCNSPKKEILTIATAANMQYAMTELTAVFKNETGILCQTIIGSSGKLTAQIKEGAPYDIFVSADMKYPNELNRLGFTEGKSVIYAFGNLVLWSSDKNITPSIPLLTDKSINHIALANPMTAPYGVAAIEVLKENKIYEQVKSKLVFGESISQTNQFIISKAAEIGFTAKSVVMAKKMQGKGNWVKIDKNSYSPIAQGLVIIKNNREKYEDAQKFYNFLFSEKGKEILNNFGYSVKE